MGGAFSSNMDFEHTCRLIVPKNNARVRPDDNHELNYVERLADVNFSLEHCSTLKTFSNTLLQGFNIDSLDGFDPELEYEKPGRKPRAIGGYTPLEDLISKPKIVFVCYLFKKNDNNKQRTQLRTLHRKNSQGSLGEDPPGSPAVDGFPRRERKKSSTTGSLQET